EVPEHRVLAPGQQGVPDHLVAEGATDPGGGRVADVVEVEQQEGAALAGVQGLRGAADSVVAQPREVDPPLVVDAHVAGRGQGPDGHGQPSWSGARPSSTSTSSDSIS